MTKARTKGAKREAKRRGRPPKEGVVREPSGRVSRKGTQYAPPPERRDAIVAVALSARCKAMGWPDSAEARELAKMPHIGCEAGRAIHDLRDPERAEMWGAIRRMRAVYARYAAILGLPAPFPASAALTAMPEPVGSDGVEVDHAEYDPRPIEDRARSAVSAMMRIEGVIMTAGVAAAVKAAVLRDEPVKDRASLVRGLLAIAADFEKGG